MIPVNANELYLLCAQILSIHSIKKYYSGTCEFPRHIDDEFC